MPDIENLLNIEDEVTQVLSDLGVNEKLNEMDDFMNQNDLKVQITNENAVVTGLVTYTCTVKDKNNTALPNKVVEWYKGTTLIGIDATDSNGVSTFSHRVTEADIYDVHAIVRGTHAGDDIRMFVKDKTNLVNHNQWTCGDHLKNNNGTFSSNNATINISTNWASNGDISWFIEFLDTGNWKWADLFRFNANDFESGTYTVKITVNENTIPFDLVLYNEENISVVKVPVVSECTTFTTSGQITNEKYFSCRLMANVVGSFYIDDVILSL